MVTEYEVGRHCRNDKKTAEASMSFETALRDAAADSQLAKLAQAELKPAVPAPPAK